MKRKQWVLATTAALLLFAFSSTAQAVGLGLYLEGGAGSGEVTEDWDSGAENDIDVDSSRFGFGFTLDTNVAQDRVFNYRLALGYGALDLEADGGGTLELKGFTLDNTFGFGIVRTPAFRLWLGPQIHLGFYSGELDSDSSYEAAVVAFGLAPVVGANINIGPTFTIALSVGYRFVGYGGSVETPMDDATLTGNEGMVFGNLSLLFRLPGDYY